MVGDERGFEQSCADVMLVFIKLINIGEYWVVIFPCLNLRSLISYESCSYRSPSVRLAKEYPEGDHVEITNCWTHKSLTGRRLEGQSVGCSILCTYILFMLGGSVVYMCSFQILE